MIRIARHAGAGSRSGGLTWQAAISARALNLQSFNPSILNQSSMMRSQNRQCEDQDPANV
jgi:hypothetical protein